MGFDPKKRYGGERDREAQQPERSDAQPRAAAEPNYDFAENFRLPVPPRDGAREEAPGKGGSGYHQNAQEKLNAMLKTQLQQ